MTVDISKVSKSGFLASIISRLDGSYEKTIITRFEQYAKLDLFESAEQHVHAYLEAVQDYHPRFLEKFRRNEKILELLVKNSTTYNFRFDRKTVKTIKYFIKHRKDVLERREIQLQLLNTYHPDALPYYDDVDFKRTISDPDQYTEDYYICEYMTKRYGVLFVKNNLSKSRGYQMLTNTIYLTIIIEYIKLNELYPVNDYGGRHIDCMVRLINRKYKLIDTSRTINLFGQCEGSKLLVCLLRNKVIDEQYINQRQSKYGSCIETAKSLIEKCLNRSDYRSIINGIIEIQKSAFWYCVMLAYKIYDESELINKIINEIREDVFIEFKKGTYVDIKNNLMTLYDNETAAYYEYLHYKYKFDLRHCDVSDLMEYILDNVVINTIKSKNYRELFRIIESDRNINELFHGEYLIMHAIKNRDAYLIEKLVEKGADTKVEINHKNLKWYVQEYMSNDQRVLHILNLIPSGEIDALKKENMILRDEITGLKIMCSGLKDKITELTMLISHK